MECTYGDSKKAEGICRSCRDYKYLCKLHLNEHMNAKHRIILMEDHELENEIIIDNKRIELLSEIDKIENENIINSNILISTIEKSLAASSEYLLKQRIKIMNLELKNLSEYESLSGQIEQLNTKLSSMYLLK